MIQPDLATLCARHLAEEETLLASVLPIVRALRQSFADSASPRFAADVKEEEHAAKWQRDVSQQLDAIRLGRSRLREELARRLGVSVGEASFALALARLPQPIRETLQGAAQRVRLLAEELVATNHWLAVHLRIHLDAYQRLLRDLTGAGSSSGRYGRAGRPESIAYPPLIQVHG